MPKLFCVSDIHSFYDKFLEALLAAGFDRDNEDHWLICCGDYFDRGDKPAEVMDYLSGLPRKVLVRGNHEDLLEACCARRCAFFHDYTNGTASTIFDLGNSEDFKESCDSCIARVQSFLEEMVDFFETKNYVFVHGWIPAWVPEWRRALLRDWQKARWENGMRCAHNGDGEENGKTIVCGHYHASWGHCYLEEPGCEDEYEHGDFSPYYAKGIIAIDACTAYSGQVNVVVLEDDFLEEKEV